MKRPPQRPFPHQLWPGVLEVPDIAARLSFGAHGPQTSFSWGDKRRIRGCLPPWIGTNSRVATPALPSDRKDCHVRPAPPQTRTVFRSQPRPTHASRPARPHPSASRRATRPNCGVIPAGYYPASPADRATCATPPHIFFRTECGRLRECSATDPGSSRCWRPSAAHTRGR